MQQTIGKVILDTTYYPGEDLYSDGPVEDELLEIARASFEEQLNAVIAERKSWPVLYHFSEIRQNILEWIPFTKEDKVLEIGAGCGAITGAIARKAGSVTSIDLSKKRSTINAYRNRDCDNLRILVGNFRDIEQNLTEKYDYITLIGVFEYSEGYMGTEEPYLEMLKCIESHLAPGGRIVLAIENRLGLKYWAGCTEDHVGRYFAGLEGYPDTSGVRTFSKKELGDLIQKAGDFTTTFYYPYPDYKLPMTLYSDQKLPEEGELLEFVRNFDRGRTALFSEPRVWNSVIAAGLFPEFSNSFLVIAEKNDREQKPEPRLIYSKYSNERNRIYAIRTDIWQQADGSRTVTKTALYPEGASHVERLKLWCDKLTEQYAKAPFVCNRCEAENGRATLEYLTEETLEERLERLWKSGKTAEAEALFGDYLSKIAETHSQQKFACTPSFEKIFGKVTLSEDLLCGDVTNVDLVCANLVLTDVPTVLDYEWTYDFPIPARFVQYRVIHYLAESGAGRANVDASRWYAECGIDEKLQQTFAQMEQNFQRSLTETHVPLRELYEAISPGVYPFEIREPEKLQVFFDTGAGYSEQNSVKKAIEHEKIRWTVELPEGCKSVRIDPGNRPCMVYIKTLAFEEQPIDLNAAVVSSGVRDRQWIFFDAEDPNLSQIAVPEGAKSLTLQLGIVPEETRAAERAAELAAENQRLRQQIEELKHPLYYKMKHTYHKLRERKR